MSAVSNLLTRTVRMIEARILSVPSPHPNPERRCLAARYEVPLRSVVNNGKALDVQPPTLHFSTDIDTQSLERLEKFRGGGRLYARLEGRLTLLYSSLLNKQFTDVGTSLRESMASESFEVPAHQWCEEILATLLPPGRLLIELDCSDELAGGSATRDRFLRARKAFFESRFEDMVAELYRLFEQVPVPSPEDDKDQYRGSLRNIQKGLRQLLNVYRHHNPNSPAVSRPVARFLLLSVMQSNVFGALAAENGTRNAP